MIAAEVERPTLPLEMTFPRWAAPRYSSIKIISRGALANVWLVRKQGSSSQGSGAQLAVRLAEVTNFAPRDGSAPWLCGLRGFLLGCMTPN